MASFATNGMFGRFWSGAGKAERVRRDFWPKIKSVAAKIPFAEDAVAAYYCTLDRRTPLRVRGMLLGALAYFVLPADAIPDFLPVLGFTDDAAVLLAVYQVVASHILPEHREAARAALNEIVDDAPKNAA